tara:strand:+ start:50 stop:226 length:177 start_codon:yes stop_codon:yes gene_type:complete
VVRTTDQWDELVSSIKSRIRQIKEKLENEYQNTQNDKPRTASEIARAELEKKKFFTDQ